MPRAPLLLRSSLLALSLALPGVPAAQTSPASPPQGATPGATAPASGEKVLARVDGMPITDRDLAIAADDPALSGLSDAQKQELLLGYLIDLKLGARAAEAAKVGDDPDFARKMAYARDKLLLDNYLEREVQKAVTPETVRKLYDETIKNMKPEPEVRARHILVESEEEARKIQARLKGGEDFAKVAAEVSKDPGSKGDGGDLGFFTKDRMVQPFAEAAFKLEPGQISEPVKSQFGWHVIKVEEKRTRPVPPFEDMKEQVESFLARKAQQDVILNLRKEAKIEQLGEAKPEAKSEAKSEAKPEAQPAEQKPAEPKRP